jgi:hypothetical protein
LPRTAANVCAEAADFFDKDDGAGAAAAAAAASFLLLAWSNLHIKKIKASRSVCTSYLADPEPSTMNPNPSTVIVTCTGTHQR